MKPLTIEELKALEVGDWVWADLKEIYPCYVGRVQTGYFKIAMHYEDLTFQITELWLYTEDFIMQLKYSDYGTKWLAYKNKEQAESKGEIVELPCNVGDYVYIIDNDRHWAKIDTIRIYDEHNGKKKIVYKWAQYDGGVDITELWDEGEFDSEEIGKTILLEKEHDEKIKALIDAENKKFEAWEQECERRRQELRGEK